jgi:predicted component of type VI protein secretion system
VRKISGATVWWLDPVTYGLRASFISSAALFSGRSYSSEAEHILPDGVVHKEIVLDGQSPEEAVERLRSIAAELKASRPRQAL